jgi:hypothetical protein
MCRVKSMVQRMAGRLCKLKRCYAVLIEVIRVSSAEYGQVVPNPRWVQAVG